MKYTGNYNLKKPDGTDIVNIEDFNENADIIDAELKKLNTNKVDKIAGKGLSTNDYTDEEKQKNQDNADNISDLQQELETHKAEIASQDTLGHVKAGKNITIDTDGTINTDIKELKDYSVVIGGNATAGPFKVAIGYYARATNGGDIALGYEAKANKQSSSALGNRSIALEGGTAIGTFAEAGAYGTTALGYGAISNNQNEGVIGSTHSDKTNKWIVPGSFTVKGTKNFEIPHPKPEKKATHVIRHGAVESPTPGDTLYRYKVKSVKENDLQFIDLPDYFVWLNKDVQIFVTPQGHFGNGYGVLNRETEQLEVHCQYEGEYNVLVIGTRNDDHPSVQEWSIKGVEREIGESWTGETYAFEVDEIMEAEEIKEEVI